MADDFLEQYRALETSAALVQSRSADWLRMSGADRLRFANGLVTCDLRSLSADDGAYGFFTDPRGRVLADAAFLATESVLWVELPSGMGAFVAEHMSRFLVADQVEIEPLEGWKTALVAGPEAAGRLESVAGAPLPASAWGGVVLGDGAAEALVIRADRRLGAPALVLAGSAGTVDRVIDELRRNGLPRASAAAVAALRIERGVPWFGLDFGYGEDMGGSFPQETGIEEWAVSFEKGCYLGQEVIARIHFRGKVNRSLRGVVFEPGSEPKAGAELMLDGEAVGVVNSLADSPAFGGPIGLAIVHHKAEPGSRLAVEGGRCRLVELPFEPDGA